METFAYYSSGGFARETRSGFIANHGLVARGKFEVLYIDDDPDTQGMLIHGVPVLSYQEAKKIPGIKMNVAFAAPALRRQKTEQIMIDGIDLFGMPRRPL